MHVRCIFTIKSKSSSQSVVDWSVAGSDWRCIFKIKLIEIYILTAPYALRKAFVSLLLLELIIFDGSYGVCVRVSVPAQQRIEVERQHLFDNSGIHIT